MNCLIVDDEPLALNLLKEYIEKIDDLNLLGAFKNPLEALKRIQTENVDIIFLDIQMAELSGIQLAKILPSDINIVFTTGYSEHAIEGFELEAIDYLLKPITFERFYKAFEKVKKRNTQVELQSKQDYMFVKTEYRLQKVNFDDILFFKGLGDYVVIQGSKHKTLTLENMKHFERVLPQNLFIRVHKSYIIALNKIDFIERNRIVIGKNYIPISATYKDDFLKRLNS
ncbi:LytTR family DNA-binding domain-containing protein [Winogradskyella sp.]|uniref:LytR/AlgR family response regulator transcription factor n=1 Tax=Winogradskyella sp. TaxID=1883156 RepID=UPI0026239AB8|nr:LytTR family DNA-binding domain-containing protein [Winogradskyella sp.]